MRPVQLHRPSKKEKKRENKDVKNLTERLEGSSVSSAELTSILPGRGTPTPSQSTSQTGTPAKYKLAPKPKSSTTSLPALKLDSNGLIFIVRLPQALQKESRPKLTAWVQVLKPPVKEGGVESVSDFNMEASIIKFRDAEEMRALSGKEVTVDDMKLKLLPFNTGGHRVYTTAKILGATDRSLALAIVAKYPEVPFWIGAEVAMGIRGSTRVVIFGRSLKDFILEIPVSVETISVPFVVKFRPVDLKADCALCGDQNHHDQDCHNLVALPVEGLESVLSSKPFICQESNEIPHCFSECLFD